MKPLLLIQICPSMEIHWTQAIIFSIDCHSYLLLLAKLLILIYTLPLFSLYFQTPAAYSLKYFLSNTYELSPMSFLKILSCFSPVPILQIEALYSHFIIASACLDRILDFSSFHRIESFPLNKLFIHSPNTY